MKQILSCVLALILILASFSSTAAFALTVETPIISFNSVESETGETVSLELSIKNNPGIAGLAISLKYDTNVLTLSEAKGGTLFSGFTAAKNFAWDESKDVTDDGILATFVFDVSETASPGDYDIEVIVRSCTNANLDDVTCNVLNGKVTLLTGNFKLTVNGNTTTVADGSRVNITTDYFILDEVMNLGYVFDYWVVESENATLELDADVIENSIVMPDADVVITSVKYLIGDTTGDFVIDSRDKVALSTFINRSTEYSKYYDVNGDGSIDTRDRVALALILNDKGSYINYVK